ncbi:MAG: MarR family winged helix-turn-helix transcriptional regulator [Pseudonocardia sp.]|nr:MarR family winged helix-turn-helix transcriptional regulator [Pseudonocardia sp.]MDN5930343.1 MarR family winged helix-turn-helix transcriptional regulator [Pseudonocardia sp.]
MSPSEADSALPAGGGAFLLTQLGTHAAQAFAERIAELDLTPPQAGLLRAVAFGPGRSQQALAQQLGTAPTRLVALVDGLEQRGLLERRRNPGDRRLHAVHLSVAGEAVMADIGRVSRDHDDAVLSALDPAEREQLRALLARVATDRGLTPGVHPGYRTLSAADPGSPSREDRATY